MIKVNIRTLLGESDLEIWCLTEQYCSQTKTLSATICFESRAAETVEAMVSIFCCSSNTVIYRGIFVLPSDPEAWKDAPIVYTDGACSKNGRAGAKVRLQLIELPLKGHCYARHCKK